VVDDFRSSRYRSIRDSELTVDGDTSYASVKMRPGRCIPSKLEIFLEVFGKWTKDFVFPNVRERIVSQVNTHKPKQRRRWKGLEYTLLLRYFLFQFLEAAQSHGHKNDNSVTLESLKKKLDSKTKFKVISSSLNLEPDIVKTICDGVPRCLQDSVQLGGVLVVDEALWAYYGKKAKKAHQLRFMPNKPHKDGILSYVISQRLRYSGRPLFLAIAPTFLPEPPTPRNALFHLNASLLSCGFERPSDWILVTDSLWSYPSHLMEFLDLGWRVVLSAKDNTTCFPAILREVSSASLPPGRSRTVTDDILTVQLVHGAQGVTSVISNIAQIAGSPPVGELPKLSYKTAVQIFKSDLPAAIVHAFKLNETDLTLPKEQLVFKATGWDVLRPVDQQGSSAPLDRDMLKGFSRAQVARIYELTFRNAKSSGISMTEMLDELFPPDTQPVVNAPAPTSRKRKLDHASLEARVKELVGPDTATHKLYDIFSDNFSCIDQMDKEFYAYGHKAWKRHLHSAALYSVAWYLMNSCHSIYEEYRRERVAARTGGNNAAIADVQPLSSTDYLIKLAEEFLVKYPQQQKKEH
jgi:hypothetical protein